MTEVAESSDVAKLNLGGKELDFHVIEHLFADIPGLHSARKLKNTISQRRLPMVDLRNDTKVSNPFFYFQEKLLN